mmetsp:Transcript_2565/g.10718  ORF Transcript_2565/g.10718 Transcript_2565/m.10718 type:complete len:231 (+) Transcript_2565:189-881(+)
MRPKTSHTSPQKNTERAVFDSIVEQSMSSSATPPPVTSAFLYPWCPLTSIAYLVRTSSSAPRSAFFKSATLVSGDTPASHISASARRAGSSSLTRVATSALPGGSVSRVCHRSRLSPLQFTMSAGSVSFAAVSSGVSASCPNDFFVSTSKPPALDRASGRTRLCDRSSTLGPEKPLCVNKNPSRDALAFFFFLPPVPKSSGRAHSSETSTLRPGIRSPPGCSPVSGTSAG